MLAPLRSKNLCSANLSSREIVLGGAQANEEPPPEIRKITLSVGATREAMARSALAPSTLFSSGTGCAARRTSIFPVGAVFS